MRRNNCGDDISKTQTVRINIDTGMMKTEYAIFFGNRNPRSLTEQEINRFIEYFVRRMQIRNGICDLNNTAFIRQFIIDKINCI